MKTTCYTQPTPGKPEAVYEAVVALVRALLERAQSV
jgi:hypothetical protein